MKYRLKYVFLFIFFSFFLKGQVNLVPNPSFEDTVGNCQNLWLKNWKVFSTFSTPDYFNTCVNSVSFPPFINTVPYNFRGYQYPRTGDGYLGLGLYFVGIPNDSVSVETECVTVKLKTPLSKGKCYYGEFFISMADNSIISTNQIGILFTKNPYYTTMGTFTNTIQPQIQWDTTHCFKDTLNWVKVSGKFISTDDEEYLTIGSFKDGLHIKKTFVNSNFVSTIPSMSKNNFYVYFDDIALYEISSPQLQSNAITICPNSDTLVLGDTAVIQTRYQWFVNGTAIDTTSFIKVKPTQTTTYVLHSTNCTTNTQTIVVTYSNNCEPIVVVEPIIPNVFTPNNDSINDVWRFGLGKGNVLKDIAVFNRWGNLMYQKTNNLSQTTVLWDGRTTSGEETSSGVYFFVLQYTDGNGEEHKKNGYISLFR
jgi:gliding motility-associated-like protein